MHVYSPRPWRYEDVNSHFCVNLERLITLHQSALDGWPAAAAVKHTRHSLPAAVCWVGRCGLVVAGWHCKAYAALAVPVT